MGLGCGVQVQVEHHKHIMLEACRPLWRQWTYEDVLKSGSPIVEYGGSNLLVFTKPMQSRKVVQLEGVKIVIIQLKWTMCKANVALDRFSILPVSWW